jgi:hypothetical protein
MFAHITYLVRSGRIVRRPSVLSAALTAPRVKRIGALAAVGAVSALSIAMLDQQAAGADTTPLGPVLATASNGADVYTSPPASPEDISTDPDFGSTKVTAQVLPVAGTFPTGTSLAGVTFKLVNNTNDEDSQTCTTDASGACDFGSRWGGTTYTLTQTDQPAGFFPVHPAAAVTVGRCIVPEDNSNGFRVCGHLANDENPGDTTDNEFQFENRGPNRQVIVGLTSSVTFAPELANNAALPPFVKGFLPGATFKVAAVAPARR